MLTHQLLSPLNQCMNTCDLMDTFRMEFKGEAHTYKLLLSYLKILNLVELFYNCKF